MEASKTIVITSPGSGIGQAIVKYLLKKGHQIVGMGRKNSRIFCESLKEHPSGCITFISCDDFTSEEMVNTAFQKVREHVTRIDGLIHCTGGSLISKEILEFSLAEFQRVIGVNLTSSFLVAREAMKWMKQTGGGNVILFGSTTGFEPTEKKGPYAVSKAGVHMLVASLALESAKHGIVVNGIAPGYVLTPRHEKDIEEIARRKNTSLAEVKQVMAAKNPWHRILQPEHLCAVVDLLLTTREIHGQIIRVDYGQILTI